MTDIVSPVKELDGFAVYGTLRPDCVNDRVWYNLGQVMPDSFYVEGFVIVFSYGNWFPYAIKVADKSRRVVVDLLVPYGPTHSLILLENLDRLEGHPNHFVREVVQVKRTSTNETVANCWMYMHHKPEILGEMVEVSFGDWKRRYLNNGEEEQWG